MPRWTPGLLAYLVFHFLFISCHTVYAQGLDDGELGNTAKQKIADLVKKVKDNPNDGDIAFASSLALLGINHAKAFSELKALYEKGSETVRAKMVKAIGQQRDLVIKGAKEYWQILSLALDSSSTVISSEVVQSLAVLESEVFFGRLLEKLKSKDSSRTLTDNAVRALSLFGTSPSGAPVISEKTLGLRVEAAKSLAPSGGKNEERLLNALGEYLGTKFADVGELEKWWGRNKNKPILQIEIEAKRRIQAEKKAAENRAKAEQQAKIQETIKRLDALEESKKLQVLLKVLNNPNAEPEVLVFVMDWLKRQKEKDALDRLKQLLNHKDIRVRVASIEAVGVVGDQKIVPEISKKLSADSSQERLAIVNTIATLGGEDACEALLKALETEKDRFVRRAVVQGLGTVGLPVAIPRVVEIVAVVAEGKVEKLRNAAAKDLLIIVANALGKILGDTIRNRVPDEDASRKLAIDFMLKMRDVDNDQVQYAAINNLGEARAQEATDMLVETLKHHTSTGIRAAAARALGKMPKPDSKVTVALFTHLDDKNTEVGRDCMRSLRGIAGLNGSGNQANLVLLTELSVKLLEADGNQHVCSLLKNLPDEKDLKPADKGNKDRLYKLRGMLAEAHSRTGEYKAALTELQKVLAYVKEPAADVLKYREMLAQAYEGDRQVTKAIDEYSRLINMVKPPQAGRYWKENVKLIKMIGDNKEKSKRIENALKMNPPQTAKEELERLKKELSNPVPKEPKTP
jgi:HEAT repeat protein